MAGILTVSPLADPSNYDRCVFADVTTGGVCEVTGADRSYKWDTKRSAGSEGETITYRGWELAKPKIKFKFWTDEQISKFYSEVIPVLSFEADKQAPKAISVYHPKLFANQIFWLVTEKIGDLIDDGAQLWTVTIEFLEYRQAKAKNATTTPEQANTSPDGAAQQTKPSALRDLERERDRLLEEFKKP